MDLFQALVVNMGVNLGGSDIGMSQQFLNDPQVCSVLKEVGSEGVAQEMRINIPGKSGLTGAFLHDFPDPVRTEGSASYGEKDFRRSVWFDEFRPLVIEIALQRSKGLPAHWYDTGLIPLAGHPQESVFKVEGLQPCGTDFGEAQSGSVEEFEDGEAPAPERQEVPDEVMMKDGDAAPYR